MVSSLLVVVLVLALLGGVGFIPAPAFTSQQRSIVGMVVFVLFIFWLIRWSGLL